VELARPGRWEFIGGEAERTICEKYVGRSVARYLPQGSKGPVRYVA
jgi:hypothetical protein